jgi:VanZ family protein
MTRHTLRRIHVAVFALFLLAWTIALWLPVPSESANKALGDPFWVFLFGKGLHITAYAFLAVLGSTIALFGQKWFWVLPCLVLHGGLTEIIQPLVGRTGRIEDVGLDAIGIAIGGLLALAFRLFLNRQEKAATLETVSKPTH